MIAEISQYINVAEVASIIDLMTCDPINPKLLKRIRRYGAKYSTGGFIFPSIVKQREIYNTHAAKQERVYKRAQRSINRLTYN